MNAAPETTPDPAIGTLHLDGREIPILEMGHRGDDFHIRTAEGWRVFTGTKLISVKADNHPEVIRNKAEELAGEFAEKSAMIAPRNRHERRAELSRKRRGMTWERP